jgi:prepilin-type N-terminal cleavage/methylation domain-containing protein
MRRTAFTLLEIMLVLAVAAIVLALAAPRLSALRDRSAVRGALGEIAASFSAARAAAIAQRTTVAVVIDTVDGSVHVRFGGRTLVHRALRATYGITLACNRDSAVYDGRGLGYGLSNLTVVVRRGRMVDTLTMSRLGRVRW